MMLGFPKARIALLMLAFGMVGCVDTESGEGPMVSELTIELGMSGDEFFERNGIHHSGRVNRQPAGLNFYKYDWSSQNRGAVIVEHSDSSVRLDDVLGVMGTERGDQSGLYAINISFGFAGGGDVSHETVKQELYQLLGELQSKGWQRVIPYNEPRLSGRSAYEYQLDHPYYSFPVDYEPTLSEWMVLDDSATWILHADGVFLELRFHRNSEKMDRNQPGNYLFTASIEGKEGYGRSFFKPKDRDQWKELWVEAIRGYKRMRLEEEKQLNSQGVEIDTSYEDPVVHPDDPVKVD